MRKMTWYALAGLLLYPFLILVTSIFGGFENASKNIVQYCDNILCSLQGSNGSRSFDLMQSKTRNLKRRTWTFNKWQSISQNYLEICL